MTQPGVESQGCADRVPSHAHLGLRRWAPGRVQAARVVDVAEHRVRTHDLQESQADASHHVERLRHAGDDVGGVARTGCRVEVLLVLPAPARLGSLAAIAMTMNTAGGREGDAAPARRGQGPLRDEPDEAANELVRVVVAVDVLAPAPVCMLRVSARQAR